MPPDSVQSAAPSFAEAVRRHPLLVLAIAGLAALAGLLWLAVRSPAHEASAEVLVTAVSADDRALLGIEVVRETGGDPTRTVQTAAGLLESPAAAEAASAALGSGWSRSRVEDAVRVEPEGQTSLLAVTARTASAADAVRVANAYADAAVRVRDRVVAAQVERRLADIRERLAAADPGSDVAGELANQRETLASVRDGDPSLSLAQRAVPPARTTGPPAWLLLGVVLAVGLAAGAVTAVALDAFQRSGLAVRRARRSSAPAPAPAPTVAEPRPDRAAQRT